jgi:hypothetical protein
MRSVLPALGPIRRDNTCKGRRYAVALTAHAAGVSLSLAGSTPSVVITERLQHTQAWNTRNPGR